MTRPPALTDPVAGAFTFVLGVEFGAMLGLWRTITNRHAERPSIGAGVLVLLGTHFWMTRRRYLLLRTVNGAVNPTWQGTSPGLGPPER